MGSRVKFVTFRLELPNPIENALVSAYDPPEKKKVMEAAAEKLRKSHLAEKALKVGDTMPDFSLPNASEKKIQLSSVLKNLDGLK